MYIIENKSRVSLNHLYLSTLNFDLSLPTWSVWISQFSMPAPKTEQKPENTMAKGKKETAKRKNTEEDDEKVSDMDSISFKTLNDLCRQKVNRQHGS